MTTFKFEINNDFAFISVDGAKDFSVTPETNNKKIYIVEAETMVEAVEVAAMIMTQLRINKSGLT